MQRILLFLIILVCASSCITNKQVQYLQHDDVNKKNLPKDTVVREYDLKVYDYKVQSNDLLYIRFASLTEKEFDFFSAGNAGTPNVGGVTAGGASSQILGDLVDLEGNITFPVIGKVHVAGMTVFEIQDKLQTYADQYLEAPIVKVRLLNFRVTVLGEVVGEKSVVMSQNRVSFLEAIGLAGGLGEFADRSNIKVIRQKGDKTEVFYVDLLQEDFMTSQHYYVNQNDIIVVPPLRQRPFRRYFGQNLALFGSFLTLLVLGYQIANN